jgi:NADPH-dependent glutamate synthase beta subunit-like oxidoreductase/NAD(P)H-flavin reductase
MPKQALNLNNAQFQDLFNLQWLQQFDDQFIAKLSHQNPRLAEDLLSYRQNSHPARAEEISALLIACAPFVEEAIAQLFNIQAAVEKSAEQTLSDQPIFAFKQWYVQREARRLLLKKSELAPFAELDAWLQQEVETFDTVVEGDTELTVATLGQHYLQDPDKHSDEINKLVAWCAWVISDDIAKQSVEGWVSFHVPQKLDYYHLVPMVAVENDDIGRMQGPPQQHRNRQGFSLTDYGMTPRQVLSEIDYCVYCHQKAGDFCSKGFPVKKTNPHLGLKKNALGEIQTGCPLEEKISEMHVLKRDGYTIGALAMIMADNPMCPATGHRICNDCMKGCIYQKQEPVNIPQVETGILKDVLALPWGVEVYDFLTRWNPLRKTQWVAKPYNGKKVMVMGMGPAGFSLAHHLLMEGCAVVGAEGLKIEPLPQQYIDAPIYDYQSITEDLDTRVMAGFGGVAEYGITVRWDKNFLKLIYITLMRRPHFQVFGGVRFGGTLKVEDAWELGFDHLAIAVGAGLPKALPVPGSMAPGMRQANDFLMALQLTGAAKKSSLANLQVRMPAVIIGGGLTGIDTATEVQVYYISQVEKTYERYEKLKDVLGEARLREQFSDMSFEVLNEFLTHGKQVKQERGLAIKEGRAPDFLKLIRSWGGVTVAYRRLLRESPAYLRNHEEVVKALEEGIYYAEGLSPKAIRLDAHGHVSALVSESRIYNEHGEWITSDEEHVLPAKSIFVATGASPNVAYEFENMGTFERKKMQYQAYNFEGKLREVQPDSHAKIADFGAFTSYQNDEHQRVSFIGDTHPVFHGSVVKAIASGKRTYPEVMKTLGEFYTANEAEYQQFAAKIQAEFTTKVKAVIRHTPSTVELQVHAPMAARNFKPGHFYRVQNYETNAKKVEGTTLQTEATALLASGVDKQTGMISLMVFEQGASSRLFASLKPNDPISLMGPSGVRTRIADGDETVLFVGGRMSAAHIMASAKAMRDKGNKILYVAGFRTADELFCQDKIEAAADKIIWVTQYGETIKPNRPQDRSISGDVISALQQYARGDLDTGGVEIPLEEVNRVLLIGKFGFLKAMKQAFATTLKQYLVKNPKVTASIYGPMQCMLKGVCAQCLVWQIDPETGKRTKAVFACSWHDQPFELVDIDNLNERLVQNSTQETLTDLWLDYLLAVDGVERV